MSLNLLLGIILLTKLQLKENCPTEQSFHNLHTHKAFDSLDHGILTIINLKI